MRQLLMGLRERDRPEVKPYSERGEGGSNRQRGEYSGYEIVLTGKATKHVTGGEFRNNEPEGSAGRENPLRMVISAGSWAPSDTTGEFAASVNDGFMRVAEVALGNARPSALPYASLIWFLPVGNQALSKKRIRSVKYIQRTVGEEMCEPTNWVYTIRQKIIY